MDNAGRDRTEMPVLDWLLAFAAWLPLPWLARLSTTTQGHWLAPGPLAAWTWTVAAGVPLFLAPDMPIHPEAYALVTAFVTICVIASTLGASAVRRTPQRTDVLGRESWRTAAWRWYVVAVVAGCVAPFILYEHTREFAGGGSFAELAMYASMARYEGQFSIPPSVRLLTAVTYFAATLAAFLTASTPAEQRRWKLGFVWLAPLVAAMLVHTAKANVLYGLVMWGAGWTAGLAYASHVQRVARPGAWVRPAIAVLVLAGLFVFSQGLRMNRTSIGDLPFLLDHLRLYVVGHMPVFGHWVVNDMPRTAGESMGAATFAGIAELLGLAHRQAGIYEGNTGFTDSNIYTAWRPLVEDFGIVGGAAFLAVLAYVAGLGWQLLRSGRLGGGALVIAYVAYMTWSPITSIFVYSMLLAVVVIFALWARWIVARSPIGGVR